VGDGRRDLADDDAGLLLAQRALVHHIVEQLPAL
jgi:hypothetical protein